MLCALDNHHAYSNTLTYRDFKAVRFPGIGREAFVIWIGARNQFSKVIASAQFHNDDFALVANTMCDVRNEKSPWLQLPIFSRYHIFFDNSIILDTLMTEKWFGFWVQAIYHEPSFGSFTRTARRGTIKTNGLSPTPYVWRIFWRRTRSCRGKELRNEISEMRSALAQFWLKADINVTQNKKESITAIKADCLSLYSTVHWWVPGTTRHCYPKIDTPKKVNMKIAVS